MRFSDKLQKIRKEHNITQEGLADKLNVSRQAVSKWESGIAYPDTEKLIQISKIFNVKLDELINDSEKVDKEKFANGKKILFMDMINNVLDFISKSVNMFWSMKIMEKIKCLFEMFVLTLIIYLVAILSTSIIVNIFRRILMFLPSDFVYFLCGFFDSILLIIWIALGGLILFKVFKSRYLDYYVFVSDSSISNKVIEEPIKELREKKEYKVVIRDPKDSSLNLFRGIGKLFMFFVKCLFVMIAIPVVLLFIFSVILLVYSLFYFFSGMFFKGISIALLGVILFLYIVIEFIYNILFNRNHKVNIVFILFIVSISLIGLGFGFSLVGISNFEYKEKVVDEVNTHVIKMEDNLVLCDMFHGINSDVVIDNSLNDIKIEVSSYGGINAYLYTYNTVSDNGIVYKLVEIVNENNEFLVYKDIINNLKNGNIVNYDNYFYDVKIYMSEDNFTKISKNNYNFMNNL